MSSLARKAVVLAAALLLLAAMAAGAAEPTIKVMVGDPRAAQRTAAKLDPVKNPYTDWIFAKTGVRVVLDWQPGEDATYNDKVTLAFASGNAPDLVFMGGNDDFAMNIVRQGALQPLNDVLGKYANLSRVYNDAYWTQYGVGGVKSVLKPSNIYPLAARGILIRQDWLDGLGLKMPGTVNDLFNVAKSFVAAKPDGQPVVGLTGRSNFSYFYALSSAYGCPSPDVQNGWYFIDKAKRQLVFWNTTDAARAYFKEAFRWYSAGLIDPELMTAGGGPFWDKINQGKVGIICHNSSSVGWLTTSIRQAQKTKTPSLAVVPALTGTGFKNPSGREGGFEMNPAFEGYFGIPKGTKNIDNVLKVLDFECTKEFADFVVFGAEGVERTMVNGKMALDKDKANQVGFWKDYIFAVDRNLISADGQASIMFDLSGGGDTTNNYLYDTAADALARTRAADAIATQQAVPGQIFSAAIPKLPAQSQYPDVQGPYRALYVKLITGEWNAGKDADWQAYLKAVDTSGITAITKAKQDYLTANSPQIFK
jgi:putative aldouronate transport system substrate-binding protein